MDVAVEARVDRVSAFVRWCESRGLETDAAKALAVGRKRDVTIKKWRETGDMPGWLPFACFGYGVLQDQQGQRYPKIPEWTVTALTEWRQRAGLAGDKQFGDAIGLSKQAVFKWYAYSSVPAYVARVCLGYQWFLDTYGPDRDPWECLGMEATKSSKIGDR